MRVAVVHNLVDGGARRRLCEQVAALDVEVVEVTTSTALPVTDRPYVVPVDSISDRLPTASRPPFRYLDLHNLAMTWRRLARLAEQTGADLIYANPDSILKGAMPLPGIDVPVLRYCDEPRRIDYEVGLQASLRHRSRMVYAPLRRRERGLDRAAILTSGALFTNSDYTASRIVRAYGRTATVVRCGVPAAMTPLPGTPQTHLLSVGSLIPSKGHDLVIQAVGRSGVQLPVVIVAHRPCAAEQGRLHRIAAQVGVDVDIRIGIDDTQLVRLYRSALATMYLSAAEPLGLVSLEAQACGTPVIVSDEGGLPETVIAGTTGLTVARDPAAAAAALRRLTDPATRDRMAAAAAEHGAGASWAASAQALRQHFEKFLRKPARPSTRERQRT